LHEISCRRCTSGRQRVLSPLQQRSAGVEDSRGPDALAIARVTITWWPPPTIKRIAAADCSDNFSTFAITLCPSSNDAI
jgi:hypothetical protein